MIAEQTRRLEAAADAARKGAATKDDLTKKHFDMVGCGKLADRTDHMATSGASKLADSPEQELMKKRFDMVGCGKLSDRVSAFNQQAEQTQKKLDANPFSDAYQKPDIHKGVDRYGRPPKGSLTEIRGIKAGNHVSKEIVDVCEVIHICGTPQPDDTTIITFGHLFQLYTRISDKCVGMLLRARKYGLVDFEGEMLYQRQDDDKIIVMLKPIGEIRKCLKESGDPANCLAVIKK